MTNTVYNKNGIPFDIDAIATDLNGKLDRDCLNYSDTGYSVMAGASMPSSTYENLTLGASGTTYTAPADGWFYFAKKASANGQYVYFGNMSIPYGLSGGDSMILLPCKKGSTKTLTYNLGGATSYFRFYYAQGSESEAQ